MTSMAELIAAHCETDELRCHAPGCGHTYPPYFKYYEGDGAVDDRVRAVSEHIAEVLAAAGYGKLEDANAQGMATVANCVRGPLIDLVNALESTANWRPE